MRTEERDGLVSMSTAVVLYYINSSQSSTLVKVCQMQTTDYFPVDRIKPDCIVPAERILWPQLHQHSV